MAVLAVVGFAAGVSASGVSEVQADLDRMEADLAAAEATADRRQVALEGKQDELTAAVTEIRDLRAQLGEAQDAPAPGAEEDDAASGGPIVVTGGEGNTDPFGLPGGDLVVTVTGDDDCFYGIDVVSTDDPDRSVRGMDLPSVDGDNPEAQTRLYSTAAGTYYLDVITGTGCTWTVTFDPVG